MITDSIELKTRTLALLKGNPCKPYKWVIELSDDKYSPRPTLVCYQPFEVNGGQMPQRWGKVGTWYASTLLLSPHVNELYIDFGQDWMVTGMRAMLREAQDIICPVDTKSIKLNLTHSKLSVFDVEDSARVHVGNSDYHALKYSAETVLSLIDKIKELELLRLKCIKEHEE
jgi:hypothetical protein